MKENKNDHKSLPVEPINPRVRELYYKIFYDRIDLTQVVDFIDNNTTKRSLSLFLDELYHSYFNLVGNLIEHTSNKDIEKALNSSSAFYEYIELTNIEKDVYSANIRDVDGKKILYGVYSLRNRITKDEKEFYYIDNTLLNYYCDFTNEGINYINNFIFFRYTYNRLLDIYKDVALDDQIKEQTEKKELLEVHDGLENKEIINSSDDLIVNPYPHIFKSDEAYLNFEIFFNSYKDEKNPLANFSFLFHAMQRDGFIHDSANRTEYIKMLSEKDIHIDKVKTYSDIGNIKDKTLIYSSMKIN